MYICIKFRGIEQKKERRKGFNYEFKNILDAKKKKIVIQFN